MILAVPFALGSPFVYHPAVQVCVFAALATARNIVGGFAGQLSLGHAVLYGIGSYTASLLIVGMVLSPWVAMFAGAAVSMLAALVIAYPTMRVCGPSFVLATIAVLEASAAFSLELSIQIVMFALIGGLGTVAGPLLGTLVVLPAAEPSRGWLGAPGSGTHGFVYGVVLVLAGLFFPRGLVGHPGTRVLSLIDRLPGGRRHAVVWARGRCPQRRWCLPTRLL